ncbi:hypothetical protein ABZ890_44325 [Streptomyces sp. NPDC046984]|uniref:hypothetical protein n=1 Tax=Streptomyces sp. NPDC046984 TaxID=3155138 RepID=UPI0033EBDEF6
MNPVESASDNGHSHFQHIVERMTEHHRRAQSTRQESSLEDTISEAAFDLGADIAHPTAARTEVGYDIEADLGVEPR